LKYLLLGLFFYAVAWMSAGAIEGFMTTPYGLVTDVKMLDFFRFLSSTAALSLLALAVLSFFFQNFWCRYLCPYGALTGIVALLSPSRIRREPDQCIDCVKCAKICPAKLPVDKLITVKSAECTGCLECVAVCPVEPALAMTLPGRKRLPAWAMAAGISGVFFAVVLLAKWYGLWNGHIPEAIYSKYLPVINTLEHP
jgi:polyferredoxin